MRRLTLQLNARLQPLDRGDLYEDPINEILESLGFGNVEGGGTLMEKSGEVKNCDIDILLTDDSDEHYNKLLDLLDVIGVPKGSMLLEEDSQKEIGRLEGFGIYLNGTDLPQEVYDTCDVNHVVAELEKCIEGQGRFYSHWQGPKDTALYFYGKDYGVMVEAIKEFVDRYPLCAQSRIVRIA